MDKNLRCTVCQQPSSLLDVVDFNKSCEEVRGNFLALSGEPCYYALCSHCGFCFAPEIANWSLEQFAEKIYNDQYGQVDPDYLETRPRLNAENLIAMFGQRKNLFRHLDYGGGQGLLADLLQKAGWQSVSYDPFVDRGPPDATLGQFGLITAFEVFEHVPDPPKLVAELRRLLAPDGVVLFSTLLSDDHIVPRQRLSWWYAAPRNGHISLFSRRSLALLGQNNGFNFGSFSPAFHTYFTTVPAWAEHLIRRP